MSSFAEVRLDDNLIIYRTVGGPAFSTSIVTTQSGHEIRNALWSYPLGKWELGERSMVPADYSAIRAFFNARQGRAQGFRWKDWADYKDDGAGMLTQISGTPAGFQMFKTSASGGTTTTRKISKPLSSGTVVKRNGSTVTVGASAGNYTLDMTTGIATFVADSSSTITAVTVGTTTQVTLTAALSGLIVGGALSILGVTGADAGYLNGIAHTITAITGGGSNIYTLSTNTAGKTITAAGSGYKYPQPADTLIWTGEFDWPVRFDTDQIKFEFIGAAGSGGAANVTDVYFHLHSLPIVELRL